MPRQLAAAAAAFKLLLVLQLVLLLVTAGSSAIKVGIMDNPESLRRLSALSSRDLVNLFGSDNFTFVEVPSQSNETYAAVAQFTEAIRSLKLDVIVGNFDRNLASVCSYLGLPFYVVSELNTHPELAASNYLSTSTVLLANAIEEMLIQVIIRFTQTVAARRAIVFITDNTVAPLNSLLANGVGLKIEMLFINNDNSSREIRQALYNVKSRNPVQSSVFVISISATNLTQAVIAEAVYLSMVQATGFWLNSQLFQPDSLILPYRNTGSTNIIIHLSNREINNHTILTSSLVNDCIRHFFESYNYNEPNMTSIMEKIFQTSISGSVSNIAFDRTTRQNRDYLFDLYSTEPNNDRDIAQYGAWTGTSTGFVISPEKTNVVQLPLIKVSARLMEPMVMMSQRGALTGFSISILEILSQDLFRYQISVSADENPIEAVRNGSAHLALNPVAQTAVNTSDTRVILSELPLIYSGIGALGHTAVDEIDFLSPLYPLTWNVWFAIIVAFIILSATLYLIDKISPNDYKRPKYTVSSAAFFVYSSFVMSKLKSSAIKPSSRIFILILWFASLMYCTSYGTNYFYLLIRRNANLQFTNLSGLYNQSSNYYWMLVTGSEQQARMRNQTVGSVYLLLANEAQEVPSFNDGMNIVLNSSIAGRRKPILIDEEIMVEYFAKRSCKLEYVADTSLIRPLYFALSSSIDSNLLAAINNKMQLMSDRGIFDEVKDRFWTQTQCSANEKLINYDDLTAVTIDKVAGIFIILGSAFVLSFLVFVLEYIAYFLGLKFQRRKADPKLEFGARYRATVASITPSGIMIKINGNREFVSNEMLSPDPDRILTASDLQITHGSVVEISYFGNDPKTGKRIFQRRG